jgi:hypothetical protein
MKIPDKVKIGGFEYAVRRNVNRLQTGNKGDIGGEIDYNAFTIELSSAVYGTQREPKEFLHELIHGILEYFGYKEHDENLVDNIAVGLFAVIKDNPKIFKE